MPKPSVFVGLAESIKRDIDTGIIMNGEKLPSCRELALKLGINPNTVQKAYAHLEEQGYLEVLPQKGAYAKKSPMQPNGDNARELAEKQINLLKSFGMTKAELQDLINKIYGENDD